MEKMIFKTCSRNRICLCIGPGDREIKNDSQVSDRASVQMRVPFVKVEKGASCRRTLWPAFLSCNISALLSWSISSLNSISSHKEEQLK